ncbi:MAG: hypothetical protein PHS05_01680 [Bacteroidales bacterium]|jgi:hypothetical protein|nr:hypothetical protein [Bacteroidales bacterium]MDY0197481.1 hypothetical protein [Tenuifilaceae bacterium]
MKKITILSIAITCLFILGSCGSKEKKAASDYVSTFEPMQIEIPAELKDNPEAVEYINGMTKAVDAYSIALDKVAAEIYKMGLKEGEEPSTMQKIKLIQVLAVHFEELSKSSEPFMKFMEQSNYLNGKLTEEEQLAFTTVMQRFEKRMGELEQKYEKLNVISGTTADN